MVREGGYVAEVDVDLIFEGDSLDELVSNLKDLLLDLESNEVPYIRHISEIVIA